MTQEDLLKQLLSSRPPESQISEAAARARWHALRRLEMQRLAPPRAKRWPILATAAALATFSVLIFWHTNDAPLPTPSLPASNEVASERPTKLILTLADGTRVIWIIDASLSL